jgi:hypothetical protein
MACLCWPVLQAFLRVTTEIFLIDSIASSADELPIRSAAMDTVASSGSGLSFLRRQQMYSTYCISGLPSSTPPGGNTYRAGAFLAAKLCTSYKLAGNMRDARQEVQLLRNAGFQVVQIRALSFFFPSPSAEARILAGVLGIQDWLRHRLCLPESALA